MCNWKILLHQFVMVAGNLHEPSITHKVSCGSPEYSTTVRVNSVVRLLQAADKTGRHEKHAKCLYAAQVQLGLSSSPITQASMLHI